jgi:hypothetical protein
VRLPTRVLYQPSTEGHAQILHIVNIENGEKKIAHADSREVHELSFEAVTRVVDSFWGCAPSAPGFVSTPDKSI